MAETKVAPFSVRYCAAWAEIRNPPLDSTNPHFKNRFASLAATLETIRRGCTKYGIVYRQCVQRLDGGELVLVTSVMDGETGEVMPLSTFPLQFNANPQQFGSALTYAKRQAAQADWCIVGDVDDDAEAAAGAHQTAPEPARAPRPTERDYSELKEELGRLAAIHGTTVGEEWSWLCKTYGNPKGMGDEDYASLVAIVKEMEA